MKNNKNKGSNVQKQTSNSALSYAGTAAAFLATSFGADAQVFYHNVSPDTAIFNENFPIDFDRDGSIDILLNHFITTNGNTAALVSAYNGHFSNRVLAHVGPQGYVYPNVLDTNDVVDANQPFVAFQDAPGNVMSFVFRDAATEEVFGDWNRQYGFMGVEFNVGAGTKHFGWVELGVDTLGSGISIFSYGYQKTPEQSILAGEGIPVGVLQPQLPALHTSRVFPNPAQVGQSLQLEFYSEKAGDLSIAAFDAQGRSLREETLAQATVGQNRLELATAGLPQGAVYFRLQLGNTVMWQKVFLF